MGLRVAIHDVTSELFESRERLIANVKVTLWQVELYSWFIFTIFFVLAFLSFALNFILILSLQVVQTLYLESFSVKNYTSTANFFNMEIKLSKRGLLFHHHHSSLAFVHLLQLSLLSSNLILMSKLDLVVSLKLFFSVSSLKI